MEVYGNNTHKLCLQVTDEDWNQLISVNLKHQFFCAQSCIPEMLKNEDGKGKGVIVNLSSTAPEVKHSNRYSPGKNPVKNAPCAFDRLTAS